MPARRPMRVCFGPPPRPEDAVKAFERLLRIDRKWPQILQWLVRAHAAVRRAKRGPSAMFFGRQAHNPYKACSETLALKRVCKHLALCKKRVFRQYYIQRNAPVKLTWNATACGVGHTNHPTLRPTPPRTRPEGPRTVTDLMHARRCSSSSIHIEPYPVRASMRGLALTGRGTASGGQQRQQRTRSKGGRDGGDGGDGTAAAPMPDAHDFYCALGVSADATLKQIKRAFRLQSLKYHPDRKARCLLQRSKHHSGHRPLQRYELNWLLATSLGVSLGIFAVTM